MMLIRALIALALPAAIATATQPGASPDTQPGAMPAASSISEPWFPSASGLADSHGWFVSRIDQRSKVDPEQWRLWHVPPRRMARTDGRIHGSPDGSLRPSALLYTQPEGIAAFGDIVYLAFKITPPGAARFATRSVMSLRARPIGVGDLWSDDPPNTLDPCPPIRSGGRLLGLVCVEGTLLALIDEQFIAPRSPEAAILRLLRMESSGWSSVDLPPQFKTEGALGIEILELSGELVLGVWRRGGTLELLCATVSRSLDDTPDWHSPIVWSGSLLTVPAEMATGASRGSSALFAAQDRLFARELETPASGDAKVRVRISELSLIGHQDGAPPKRLASVEGVGEDAGVVALPGLSRVLVAWHDRPDKFGSPPNPLGVYELSLNSGSAIYVGPAVQTSPITGTDAKLLVITLAGLSALTLLFILRTSSAEPELHLPDGFALAEPGRRLFATGVDALLALCVGASLAGTTPAELLTFDGILSAQAVWAIVYGLGVGMVTGTLTEVLSGRSLGKVLAGCAVIAADPNEARPPSLGASFVRNAVKWGLPPVAALALLDSAGRHRGETLARTAVVIQVESGDEGRSGGGGGGQDDRPA
ncbi:MAG: RDD family protein [Planctomycetota bacterium]